MNHSTPGLPVHHQLPQFTQTQRPSSQWCHPAISSSVIPFSSCPQPLPASESFPMSQLFTWGGQSTGVSSLASFLPKKSLGWSPSEWTGWISLQSKGLSRVFSNTTVQKHQFFFTVQLSHPYMTTGKTIALTRWTFVGKVMSLLLKAETMYQYNSISIPGLFHPTQGSPLAFCPEVASWRHRQCMGKGSKHSILGLGSEEYQNWRLESRT